MRHPERRFPGVLIQGDTLFNLHSAVVAALDKKTGGSLSKDARIGLEDVAEFMGECLDSYRTVLREHGIELPFYE